MRSLGNLTDFQKSTGWEKIVLAKSQWLRSYEQIIVWDIGFSAISRLRDVGLRRSILHSIPLVKTLLLRYHVKKGKVDPRCRPLMLCLNASSTICRRIGVIFSIFWSIHHSTRLDERNRMQYRSPQSDDPNSNEDQIIAQRYCSTLRQRMSSMTSWTCPQSISMIYSSFYSARWALSNEL